jgi:hypothetical protein
LLCVISVFRGIIIGTVAFPVVSVLYLLKVAEYFLVFYLAFNLITKKTDARFYLSVIFATALLISIYGIIEHFFLIPTVVSAIRFSIGFMNEAISLTMRTILQYT